MNLHKNTLTIDYATLLEQIKKNRGATMNRYDGSIIDSAIGYEVGMRTMRTVDRKTELTIDLFKEVVDDVITRTPNGTPNFHIGFWYDSQNNLVVDITRTEVDFMTAFVYAKNFDQTYIWDWNNGKAINLALFLDNPWLWIKIIHGYGLRKE